MRVFIFILISLFFVSCGSQRTIIIKPQNRASHDVSDSITLTSKTKKNKRVEIASVLPPILLLLSPSVLSTTKNSIVIRFSVDSNSKIEKFVVTRNGEQINRRTIQRVKGEKITISLDEEILERIDDSVEKMGLKNRSNAIENILRERY